MPVKITGFAVSGSELHPVQIVNDTISRTIILKNVFMFCFLLKYSLINCIINLELYKNSRLTVIIKSYHTVSVNSNLI